MSGTPLVELRGLEKAYGAPRSLRIRSLMVGERDRINVAGLDRTATEMVVLLVTGAALPDAGSVLIAGADTRGITTDTDWLTSLDRFGMVTPRALLLDQLPVVSNLALPLTLSVEPMEPYVRQEVDALAAIVGLPPHVLEGPVAALDPLARMLVHLGRALANRPSFLLLEDPTRDLPETDARVAFGRALAAAADRRGVGWLSLSGDTSFITASRGERLALDAASGVVSKRAGWWPWGRR